MSHVVGRAQERVARKQHVCYWCGELILPMERYTRWAWADEGTVDTVKVHVECNAAWRLLHPFDAECVGFATFARGCLCANNECECDKK